MSSAAQAHTSKRSSASCQASSRKKPTSRRWCQRGGGGHGVGRRRRVSAGGCGLTNEYVRGYLAVSYQSEPVLGLLVPVELRERYSQDGLREATLGTATYGNFRRFRVVTDETIGPVR
jgi:hypothetical protein